MTDKWCNDMLDQLTRAGDCGSAYRVWPVKSMHFFFIGEIL